MFDELSLRKSSRQGGNNVNVIRHAAYVHEICAEVAGDCCEIGMHARSHICIQPGFTILAAEDDVNDDFTEGLSHVGDDVLNQCRCESRFQRSCSFFISRTLRRCPRLTLKPRFQRWFLTVSWILMRAVGANFFEPLQRYLIRSRAERQRRFVSCSLGQRPRNLGCTTNKR